MAYIEVAVLGTLGGLPTERHTSTGKTLTTFSIAVRDAKSEETEWVNVSAFEDVAATIPREVSKGEKVYVEGRGRLNRFTGKDGTPRANLLVTAFKVQVLDRIGFKRPKKPKTERAAESRPGNGRTYDQAPLASGDDKIPF